jgi:hypothetical protein
VGVLGIPPHPREHIEDAIQCLAGDPDAGVFDIDPHLALGALDAYRDRAAGGAVLRRVVQNVGEDLREEPGP